MIRTIKLLLLCCCLGAPLGGCAAVMPVIPQIVSVVTDAMVIMGIIDNAAQEYFRTHPNVTPEARAKYVNLYQKALNALNTAQHALTGVEDLDQKQYDAAFSEFRKAYQELTDLLDRQGMLNQGYLSAAPGEQVYVPAPVALAYKVEE